MPACHDSCCAPLAAVIASLPVVSLFMLAFREFHPRLALISFLRDMHARRRPPLDLSLEFIMSGEGSFIRNAVVADLKQAAVSSMKRKIPGRFRNRRASREPPAPSPNYGHPPAAQPRGGALNKAAAREASRRSLKRRVLGEARRRPILVVRVGAAVVGASGRVVATVSGALTRVLCGFIRCG